MEPLVIDWDGSHVPDELRRLPPGRYALEPIDVGLSPEQDDGVRAALEALDAGRGIPLVDVIQSLRHEPGRR